MFVNPFLSGSYKNKNFKEEQSTSKTEDNTSTVSSSIRTSNMSTLVGNSGHLLSLPLGLYPHAIHPLLLTDILYRNAMLSSEQPQIEQEQVSPTDLSLRKEDGKRHMRDQSIGKRLLSGRPNVQGPHKLKFGIDEILNDKNNDTESRIPLSPATSPTTPVKPETVYDYRATDRLLTASKPLQAPITLVPLSPHSYAHAYPFPCHPFGGAHFFPPPPLRHHQPHINTAFLQGRVPDHGHTGSSGNAKRKRSWSRAVFSALQRKGLEKRFEVQKYVTKPDRRQLAAMLGLTDAQVKVWFQNRRMKWRHMEEQKKKRQQEEERQSHIDTRDTEIPLASQTQQMDNGTPISTPIYNKVGVVPPTIVQGNTYLDSSHPQTPRSPTSLLPNQEMNIDVNDSDCSVSDFEVDGEESHVLL